MNIDVYYKYNFSYDKNIYMRTLKKALIDKGYKTLCDFYSLVAKYGCESYETAKSYFNLRRVLPIEILGPVCKQLKLSSAEIMFPNSIPIFEYTKGIGANSDELNWLGNLFQMVFVYDDITPNYIYTLSMVLAKYNYMLQKYYYASLSNNELRELYNVSICFLKNRETNELLNWEEFNNWIKELNTNDFIDEFYNKYTFACFNPEDGEMVAFKDLLLKKQFTMDNKLFVEINNLLSFKDIIK